MTPLRRATIRLAHSNPKLRPHLLKALREAADFDPTEIAALEPGGALESDTDEPYMGQNFTEVETTELSDKQEAGTLGRVAREKDLRVRTIRLAREQPKGSPLRRALLETLAQ